MWSLRCFAVSSLLLASPAAAADSERRSTVAAGSRSFSAEVAGITSAFYVRSGGASGPEYQCTIGVHKEPLDIMHSFGSGGGGEVWQHAGLVVTLRGGPGDGGRPGGATARSGRSGQVVMRIQLAETKMPFEMQPASLYVGAIPEAEAAVAQGPMHWEVHGRKEACPPQVCLMPRPEVSGWLVGSASSRGGGSPGSSLAGEAAAAATAPQCGWAPALNALTFQSEPGNVTTLDVDISRWLARNVSAFKVWAVPLELGETGMWQTRAFSLASLTLHHEESGGESVI